MNTPDVLYFKDNLSAFEYASKFTPVDVAIGVNAIGIVVLDSLDKAGHQVLVVKLANEGGTQVSGIVAHPALNIKAGDLVAFRLQMIKPEIPQPFDKIGFVGAKVAPEWSVKSGWRLVHVPGVYAKPSIGERIANFFRKL